MDATQRPTMPISATPPSRAHTPALDGASAGRRIGRGRRLALSLCLALSVGPLLAADGAPVEGSAEDSTQKEPDAGSSRSAPSLEPSREGGRGQAPAAGKGESAATKRRSTPEMERMAFFEAVDGGIFLPFEMREGAVHAKAREACARFAVALEAHAARAKVVMKELAELRRSAPANEPPSEAFRKKAKALEAARPKLADLRREIIEALGTAEFDEATLGAVVKALDDDSARRLAEARAEEARRIEVERKQRLLERLERERLRKEAEKSGAR